MDLTIRLFAVARQKVGSPELVITLAEGSTVGQLRRILIETIPSLAELLPRMMVAVDSDYVDDSRVLSPDSEVALIPPVSGG